MFNYDELFTIIDSRADEFRQLLKELVCLSSYTPDKADVDRVGGRIRAFADQEGFAVKTVPFEKAGNALLITFNEKGPLPPVAFTGHLDTVHPRGTFKEPFFREENGIFYGPGVFDMKGGLVIGLLVMSALKDAGYRDRPIRFIMISDEELSEGLTGEAGKDFIRDNARGCAAAITLEGGDGKKITVGRKGSIRYKVYVHGRASHAGSSYSKGISAIKEAAEKILAIEAPSDQEQITYNCGMIQGGTSPNTVPGEVMFTLYNRYWTFPQLKEIRDHVETIIGKSFIPGTRSDFEVVGQRFPMEATEGNYALAAHIAKVSEALGFGERVPVKTSSGSDASYTTMAGAPSVCSMGPSGGKAHAPEEYMEAESLVKGAKLLAAVIAELPADFGNHSKEE